MQFNEMGWQLDASERVSDLNTGITLLSFQAFRSELSARNRVNLICKIRVGIVLVNMSLSEGVLSRSGLLESVRLSMSFVMSSAVI